MNEFDNKPQHQESPHDPWAEALDELESSFNPLADQKADLLDQLSVNDADLPLVDQFFDALAKLEEVWKAPGPELDRKKMTQSVQALFEIEKRMENLNPILAEALHTLHQKHVARLKADGERESREHWQALAEQLRFGMIAETAISEIRKMFPETLPREKKLLPEPLRVRIERVIRPYYDALNRSYQDDPSLGEDEPTRFEAYFWSQNHTEMLEELRVVISNYYSSAQ